MLAETDVTSLLKDAGFAQWLVYAIGAAMLWEKVSKFISRDKPRDVRVMGGEMQVSERQRFADDAETKRALKELKATLDSMIEMNTAEHATSRTAGENRVRAIAEVMDKETDEVRAAVNTLASKVEAHTAALHEKINVEALKVAHHDEALAHLKSQMFLQQQRIDNLQQPHDRKPRT